MAASLHALIFLSFLFDPQPVFSSFPFLSSVTPSTTTSRRDHPAELIFFLFPLTSSHLVIRLYFLPSVLEPFICVPFPASSVPLSTHLPRLIQSLLTIDPTFPPVLSGQRSPLTLSTHRQPSQGSASSVTLLQDAATTVLLRNHGEQGA